MNMKNNYSLDNLTGKLLIASPHYFFSDVFKKSVIYITCHDDKGAIGLIINRLVNHIPFDDVMKMVQKDSPSLSDGRLPIYLGGPVDPERGFILHSADYNKNLLLECPNNLAVSSNIEILKDIAKGAGPENSLFVLGYTGWGENQLHQEMSQNMWIVSDYHEDILFKSEDDSKWNAALKHIGVDNRVFSGGVGFC